MKLLPGKVSSCAAVFTAVVIASLGLAQRSDAVVSIKFPTITQTGSIEISHDISFTLTSPSGGDGNALTMVMDQFVTPDANPTLYYGSVSNAFNFRVNSDPVASAPFDFLDNVNFSQNAWTPDDGYFFIFFPTLVTGEVFTVTAQTITLAAGSLPAGFNPEAEQTFAGNMFLTDGSGNRISGNVSVGLIPEPSSTALLGLGGLALMLRRRR